MKLPHGQCRNHGKGHALGSWTRKKGDESLSSSWAKHFYANSTTPNLPADAVR